MSVQNTNALNPSAGVSKFDSARLLYMAGDTTQKSIAATVGVSERTMHSWIKDNGWDRLRNASRTAPAIIAENMFSQIVELQNDIASREEGKRYPTMQEAELTRKLCLSIDKMKTAPALSQSMQVLRLFRTFAQSHYDTKFHLQLNQVIEHFLEGEAKNGYFPYQIEYGSNEPNEINNNEEAQPEFTDQEMRESFSPAKERQNNEKRSLFIIQSGDNSAHCASPSPSERDWERLPSQPEISTHITPADPPKTATAEVFNHPTPTFDTTSDPQKPEVKRKFSHGSLNKIASQVR